MIGAGLYPWLRPVLFALEPERAHGLALAALRLGLAGRDCGPDPESLAQSLWGLRFPNPIGLAAGFDKDGAAFRPALRLGFGFAEIGSVTPKPQPGNPRPRLFRSAADGAIVNRLGFNSRGAGYMAAHLMGRDRAIGIVGVNLGKNRDAPSAAEDYARGLARLAPLADYVTINVSSPNTPGLRELQIGAALRDLLDRVEAERRKLGIPVPLLLKIAPDLGPEDLAEIAAIALERKLDGLILGNTTLTRPSGLDPRLARESGGLSGRPLFALSTAKLAELYRLTAGRLPLIGTGGIASGADAYAKIKAGASLVQLYSALVFQGPGLIRRIKRELADLLAADGYRHIGEAIGADHRPLASAKAAS